MIKKYVGLVEIGDAHRSDDECTHGAIIIGDVDVIQDISETVFAGPVTVGLADARFDGELAIEIGWGYSAWTPMDDDKLTVGPHNIIDLVQAHEGEIITLWVADEPVNLLE